MFAPAFWLSRCTHAWGPKPVPQHVHHASALGIAEESRAVRFEVRIIHSVSRDLVFGWAAELVFAPALWTSRCLAHTI